MYIHVLNITANSRYFLREINLLWDKNWTVKAKKKKENKETKKRKTQTDDPTHPLFQNNQQITKIY